MPLNFVGSDPGDANYGYSVVAIEKKRKLHVDILEVGMFTSVINNLTDKESKPPKSKRRKRTPMVLNKPFPDQLQEYLDAWDDIIGRYNPVKFSSERFQARGLRGRSIECVSMMNAAMCTKAMLGGIAFEVFTAATWKNQVNKIETLDSIYAKTDLPNHSVDACFITIHGALAEYGLKWTDVNIKGIVKQLSSFQW